MDKIDIELINNALICIFLIIFSGLFTCFATGDQWDKDNIPQPKCTFYFNAGCNDLKGED